MQAMATVALAVLFDVLSLVVVVTVAVLVTLLPASVPLIEYFDWMVFVSPAAIVPSEQG
jgi:hypothetical protein